MSYILDALKKSEKERQRGSVPDVLTVQEAAVQEPKKRSLLPYLILGVLLLSSGVFVLWSSQSKKPPAIKHAAMQKQDDRAETVSHEIALVEKKSGQKIERVISTPDKNKTRNLTPSAIDEKPAPKKAVEEKTPVEPAIRHDSPAPGLNQTPATQPVASPKSAEAAIPAPENKIYSLTDLPPALRQNLPQFTISTHIHSPDPASRLIRINGQTLREGQDLAAGLKLEEITSDGVIFSCQNYRFRVGVR